MESPDARLDTLREKLNTINNDNDVYWGMKSHSPAARERYRQRIVQLAWVRTEMSELQGSGRTTAH
jgi:hypothetical protein